MDTRLIFDYFLKPLAVQTQGANQATAKPAAAREVDWSKVAKVTTVAVGTIAALVLVYNYSPVELPSLNDRRLVNALNPICRDAVKHHCKTGPGNVLTCLRDYLVEDWTPDVLVENNHEILCSVSIQATNCAALVGQKTAQMWNENSQNPFIFTKNYERIFAEIPNSLPNLFARSIRKFHNNGSQIIFKSHIFCSAKETPFSEFFKQLLGY